MECEICGFLKHPSKDEESLRIYVGEHWIVTLRRDQEYLGTCFITAKRHVESLPALSKYEEHEFMAIRDKLLAVQQDVLGAQVVNISCLMNLAFNTDGEGRPHVHYHVKPRYARPVEFAGETFEDRQFGRYIRDKHPHEVSDTVAQEIIAVLKRPFTR